MTASEASGIFSCIAVLFAGNVIAWRSAAKWMRSKDALFALHRSTVNELYQVRAALYEAQSLVAQQKISIIDAKTASLVRLAVSNNQEHEQHAAAMLVCRRIARRIQESQ